MSRMRPKPDTLLHRDYDRNAAISVIRKFLIYIVNKPKLAIR